MSKKCGIKWFTRRSHSAELRAWWRSVEATAQQPRRTLQDGRPSVWFGRLSELLLLMASFLQFGLLWNISWNTRLLGAKKFNSAKIIRQYILQSQKIKCTSVFRLNVLVYHNRHRVTLVEILPLISYNIKCIQVYNRFKMVVKHHCAWTRYTQNYQLLKSRVN